MLYHKLLELFILTLYLPLRVDNSLPQLVLRRVKLDVYHYLWLLRHVLNVFRVLELLNSNVCLVKPLVNDRDLVFEHEFITACELV